MATEVIALTCGSKWRRFLEPNGHSASLLLVSKVKGQDSTLAIVAPQRLEFQISGRPKSSVLRKRRPGKGIFALLPFDNNASVEERLGWKSLKGRKVARQCRRRSRHCGKKGRDVRGDYERTGVSQSLEDTIKGEGREAGDTVTLCTLGSERDAML